MKLEEVIHIDNFPQIDLHGLDRDTARVEIDLFIKNNIKLKNDIVVIIHGVGTGILKNETHKFLKNNKNVIDYKLHYNNVGSTIVKLKV